MNQNYINPLWQSQIVICHCKDASYTSESLSTEAKGTFVFIEFNILIFFMISRKKDTSKPRTRNCHTTSTTATAPASLQEKKKATKPLGHALDTSKTRKSMLQQPPGRLTLISQDTRILSGCHLPFLPHRRMHTPPHEEVSHQFQEAIRSWIETSNNTETPGNRRDLYLVAVLLARWPNHHL